MAAVALPDADQHWTASAGYLVVGRHIGGIVVVMELADVEGTCTADPILTELAKLFWQRPSSHMPVFLQVKKAAAPLVAATGLNRELRHRPRGNSHRGSSFASYYL